MNVLLLHVVLLFIYIYAPTNDAQVFGGLKEDIKRLFRSDRDLRRPISDSDAEIRLQRYHLGDSIGKGGWSEVVDAHDKVTGKPVAVKVMMRTRNEDAVRFEAGILRRHRRPEFKSRHLMYSLDEFMTGDNYYLVMPRMMKDLRACQTRPLSLPEIRNITRQLLKAMIQLEKNGITHNDIKPDNILVESLEPEVRIKLTDFTLSVDGKRDPWSMSTPTYAAPEVFFDKTGSSASDVWSLGITLAELFLCQHVFPRELDEFQRAFVIINALDGEVPMKLRVRILQEFRKNQEKYLPLTRPVLRERLNEKKPPLLMKYRKQLLEHVQFVDFVMLCVQWSPLDRPTLKQLKRHPFVRSDKPRSFDISKFNFFK